MRLSLAAGMSEESTIPVAATAITGGWRDSLARVRCLGYAGAMLGYAT
jgi:hypothetical protein